MTTTRKRVKRMALLPKKTRIKYFKDLGLGEYSPSTILKFQKMAFTNPKEHDKKYGVHTDKALRHWHNVWRCCNPKHFKPEEFRCPCGRCTGYPTWMKANELKNVQAIRDHFGKPMTITSGLRCKAFNSSLKGSSPTSKHLEGRAVDFKIPTATETLARRKVCINWARTLPKFRYSYCNGYEYYKGENTSYGQTISRPNMGNAIHIDSYK